VALYNILPPLFSSLPFTFIIFWFYFLLGQLDRVPFFPFLSFLFSFFLFPFSSFFFFFFFSLDVFLGFPVIKHDTVAVYSTFSLPQPKFHYSQSSHPSKTG